MEKIMTIWMGNSIKASADVGAGQPYSLTILNENAKFQQFALFQTIPQVIGASFDPISLAWMVGGAAAGSPTNPSQSQFRWTIDYAATAGYIQDLGTTTNPRSFQTASQVGVMIDSANTLDVAYQGSFPYGAPGFPNAPTDGTKGLIVVKADGSIPTVAVQASQKVSVNVGLAMAGRSAIAVQLEPNLIYQFTPKPRYYVLAGAFVQGQVIDTAISSAAYEIVFQGVTDMAVRFTQNNQFVAA
jgi:rhizosphere induced protein